VQAAVIGNPFVVVYRVSALTFAVAKQLVEYPPEITVELDDDGNLPIAMVNLIAGRRVVPELLQSRFNAEDLAAAMLPLIAETNQRAQMVADLAEVRERLLPPGVHDPIARAAEAILQLLPQLVPIQSSIP